MYSQLAATVVSKYMACARSTSRHGCVLDGVLWCAWHVAMGKGLIIILCPYGCPYKAKPNSRNQESASATLLFAWYASISKTIAAGNQAARL